jgi:hypothetical protein
VVEAPKAPIWSPASGATERALPTELGAPAVISGRQDHGTEFNKRGKGRSVIYRVFITDEDYVVMDADSPEDAMLKLRDAGLEPVKAEPFDAHPRRSKGSAPAR